MRYRDKKIKTLGDLVDNLEAKADPTGPVWFRGQPRCTWGLVPSLARNKNTSAAEAALIKRFKQNALTHLSDRPASEWEWMFLMQHYRLPTRLLDWTESPLVALYFAIEQPKHKKYDGALWCLDPIALNHHANIKFSSNVEIPAFDHDDILKFMLQ